MSAGERTIVSLRRLEQPRERLFEAFRDPAQLSVWWGPRGFTNTFQQFECRPGGTWRFTMRSPAGASFENVSDFVEVAPPERIVFVHQLPMHRFRMTMTFDEEAGGGATTLTWRMEFDSAADADEFRDLILEANEQNFDRLEEHLGREH